MLIIKRYQPCRDARRFKLLLSTAILSSLTGTAYAGSCTPGTPGTYICSGAEAAGTDITQTLTGSPLEVTTAPGFGLVTSIDNALTLIANGGLSFTDNNASIIKGAVIGIYAANDGGGGVSISTTGTAEGGDNSGAGIFAHNTGTDLTISAVDTIGGSNGIYAENLGSGALSITSTGTVSGTNQYGIGTLAMNYGTDTTLNVADVAGSFGGIYAGNFGSGALSITSTGVVGGTSLYGIYAVNDGTDLTFNVADVVGGVDGIYATNRGTGLLSISATGTVTGTDNFGIFAANNVGTDLTINAIDVVGGFNGIHAGNFGSGALSITSTGTVSGTSLYGIFAMNNGTDLTLNVADVVGGVDGIHAVNHALNGSTGSLSITTGGTVTGTNGTGINTQNLFGPSSLIVRAGSTVQGVDAGIDVDSAMSVDILNSGTIRNLSNLSSALAIQTTGAVSTLTNDGLIQGTVQLSDAGNSVINNASGIWNTAGGTNEFGTLTAANSVLNNGTIITANGAVTDPAQTTIFNNVGAFTNAGVLTMANGRAGDITVINGDYVGKSGSLRLDTVLGDDSAATDKLIINGNTSGNTSVRVDNLGGSGAQTLNGIEIIQVNGLSDGEFVKSGRIVAGTYDYSLVRGVGNNATNWYLTSELSPVDPIMPVDPNQQVQRPESGAYSANLAAANNMFVTRLHDRLGETQYIDALTGEHKVTSLWLRNEGGHNRSRDGSGQLKTQANRYVVQLGGDIVQWSHNGMDRFHLGLMAGYGNSRSTTVSSLSGYNAKGTVDGYSTGIYGTWYANDADKSGMYVDGWVQYNWFNNTVDGQDLAREEYQSKGVTAAVESGYTLKVGENTAKSASYFIQPKVQVTWMGVKADDHKEANGTHVTEEGNDNIKTRLGVKAFMNGYSDRDKGKDRVFQPFVEAHWVHNTQDVGTNMNGVTVKQDGAANIAELKVGVEGQLSKEVNLWGNVGQQVGNKGYSDTTVMLGVKYNF